MVRVRHAGWIRMGSRGPGIAWKGPEARPLFSERNGYERRLRLGGWRLFWLRGLT